MSKSLERRINVLLGQLAMLSEAPAQAYEKTKLHRPHAESTPPKGAHPDRKGNPDPDDSLLHYFLEGLEHKTGSKRIALVAEVELRLAKRVDGKVQRATMGAVNVAAPVDSEERDRRIAEDYQGLEPAEVAAVETEAYGWCPQANVRKVRLMDGRDPKTGAPKKEANKDKDYARELQESGLSIGSIAIRMGKPKSTVQGWLKGTKGNGKAA